MTQCNYARFQATIEKIPAEHSLLRTGIRNGRHVQAQGVQVRARRRDAGQRPVRDLGPHAGGQLHKELAAGRQGLQRRAAEAPADGQGVQRREAAVEAQREQELLQGDDCTCPAWRKLCPGGVSGYIGSAGRSCISLSQELGR